MQQLGAEPAVSVPPTASLIVTELSLSLTILPACSRPSLTPSLSESCRGGRSRSDLGGVAQVVAVEVLAAVAAAVVVGVLLARVRVGAVLAVVREAVAVPVAPRIVLLDVEVVALLPLVGHAVVVMRARQRWAGGERGGGDDQREGGGEAA